MPSTDAQVRLEPWGEADFWLLRRTNAPEMTEHLGGPETDEQLAARHRRYVALREPGRMYRIVAAPPAHSPAVDGAGAVTVGSIGFWERQWRDTTVWETGWGVLPEHQRKGIAVRAARAVAKEARAAGRHRYLHAFPDVHHTASNAVCRRAGFELLGSVAFEYPKGRWMRSNDWRLDFENG